MSSPHAAVGRRLRLAGHFAEPVVVESVDDYGDVVTLRVRTARGAWRGARCQPERARTPGRVGPLTAPPRGTTSRWSAPRASRGDAVAHPLSVVPARQSPRAALLRGVR